MFVSETDTPEQVKAKCKSFVARFETYIANLNAIINSGDELASEMRKASNVYIQLLMRMKKKI